MEIIPPQQHGFFPGRNTATNLMEKTSFINRALDRGNTVDVIYFDVAKAFDQMPHVKLYEKLSRLSIPYNLLLIVQSFISRRKYRVSINGDIAQKQLCPPVVCRKAVILGQCSLLLTVSISRPLLNMLTSSSMPTILN